MRTMRPPRVLASAVYAAPREELPPEAYEWSEVRRAFVIGHARIVYYMRMDRLIKIGTTVDLRGRCATIMPQGVLAVEFGGYREERDRHQQFAADHSHREWFWLRDALWDHIRQLRDTFAEREGETVDSWVARHAG